MNRTNKCVPKIVSVPVDKYSPNYVLWPVIAYINHRVLKRSILSGLLYCEAENFNIFSSVYSKVYFPYFRCSEEI